MSSLLPCLKIGITLAIFRADGTIPVEKEQLMISDSGAAMSAIVEFAMQGSISSGPVLWVVRRE